VSASIARPADERVNWPRSIPFFLVHLLPLLAIFTGVTTKALVLCAVLYFGRMFFITAGYHRYFSHKSYKTNRVFQFILALGGASAAQKGALWWASHHRLHHRYSDTELDIHSPQKGFWWSHVGWILANKYKDTDYDLIKDFSKYPELVWLNKHDWVAPWALGFASYFIAGWSGLLIGFFLSTVLLWHGTFTVNSLNHVFGKRRYATTDTSRNSAILAIWTMGEGWHNNHHYYAASARQGFFWWEFDFSYYVLKGLSFVGVVRDLKVPPARVKAAARVRDGQIDIGMFRAHWNKANTAFHDATARLHERMAQVTSDVTAADLTTATEAPASPSVALASNEALTSDTTLATTIRNDAAAATQSNPGASALTAPAATGPTHVGTVDAAPLSEQHAKLAQLEELVRSSRAAFEECLADTLRTAEEFSRASRRRQRELVSEP
jgi:stearoyl-CoA desaturase (delta-9 desaturase)